jgi:hypothetical protein
MDIDRDRIGRLSPEEKVAMTIAMTDACVNASASGIKSENPDISDKELLSKLRMRLEYPKRLRSR